MGQLLRIFILNSIDSMRGYIAQSCEVWVVEQAAWVQILALALSGCVTTMSELFNQAVPCLHH